MRPGPDLYTGKEFEATTDGTKNTDVNLYVYEAGKEVGKDDSPGPKSSVKVTPATAEISAMEAQRWVWLQA